MTNKTASIGSDAAPRIDCHAHIFDAQMPASPDAWTVPDYEFSADDLIRKMGQFGVEFGVLSGLSISGDYNDYVIRALRNHKQLRGTAIVDPSADLYTLERMQADGIVGIRLQLARAKNLPDFDSFAYRKLLRRVRDLGWHVQVAIEGPELPGVLDPLLAAGVNVVVDHFGHPDPAQPLECAGFKAMLKAVDTGQCWVKVSAGFRLAGTAAWQENTASDLDEPAAQIAPVLIDKVGTDRLLWGSDAPFVGYEQRVNYEQVLASYRSWLPDPVRRSEVCDTGLKLYFG